MYSKHCYALFFIFIVLSIFCSYSFYPDLQNDPGILDPDAGGLVSIGTVVKNENTWNIKHPELTNPGNWYSVANIPNPTYYGGGICYQRNDTGWLYVIGGNGTGIGTSKVQRFNLSTNSWQIMQDLPATIRVNGTAVLCDSIYSAGGITPSGSYINSFYQYSINSNNWSSRANLPTLMAYAKVVDYQDSLIYLAGGSNGSLIFNSVYIYNAITNTWRNATPMPMPRVGGAFTRIGDTLVYVGGADISTIYNTTFKGVINQTDRSIIQWTWGAPFPAGPMFRMDSHPWGCKGILITGGSSAVSFSSTSNVCYSYSPANNTWTQQVNKPTAWTCGQSGAVHRSDGSSVMICASGFGGTTVLTQTEIFYDFLQCSMVGNIHTNEVPLKAELFQNYPNPFNAETIIKFNVSEGSYVNLSVYDISGRLVTKLISEQLYAGKYTLSWNAGKYSSGVFIYKLEITSHAGNQIMYSETRKMVLLK